MHITQSEFQKELSALVGNKKFADFVKSQGSLLASGDGKMSTDQQIASVWLTTLIRAAAIDGEFQAQKLNVTTSDKSSAEDAEKQEFQVSQTDTAFPNFSKAFQTAVLGRRERVQAIVRYYTSCPSGRLIELIASKTHDDAEAAFGLIRAGQQFGAVAKAKSIDSSSAPNGGAVGCLTPGQFIPEIQHVAEQVQFDTVTVPVKTKSGYVLVLVRRWDPTADQQYVQALQQVASNAISDRIKALKVWVNPMYGSWAAQTDAQGQVSFAVKPPPLPGVRDQREKKAAQVTTSTLPAGG